MNKLLKIIISILGGVNSILTVFIPTLLTLLIVVTVNLNQTNQYVLILSGLLSTLYRALSYLIPVIE